LLTNRNLNTSIAQNVEGGLGDEAGAATMTLMLVGEGQHFKEFFFLFKEGSTHSIKARWGAMIAAVESNWNLVLEKGLKKDCRFFLAFKTCEKL
jgi:hypothetical protein